MVFLFTENLGGEIPHHENLSSRTRNHPNKEEEEFHFFLHSNKNARSHPGQVPSVVSEAIVYPHSHSAMYPWVRGMAPGARGA